MNEFLKIKWRNLEAADYEQTSFISEEVISQSYVYKQFDKNQKLIEENDKDNSTKQIYPSLNYIPGSRAVSKCTIKSSISKKNQESCLLALKLLQSRKNPLYYTANDKHHMATFNDLKSKIAEENARYCEYVKNAWGKSKITLKKIRPIFYNYLKHNLQLQFKRYKEYSQYYKEVGLINMLPSEHDSIIDITNTENVVEFGTLARFALPNLTVKCTLPINTLPSTDDVIVNSKLPVAQDENIEKILQTHKVDFVITSSGLKRLLDDTDLKAPWIIPIIIQDIKVEEAGVVKNRKVIFIDKPLPKSNPDKLDLLNYGYKRLIKSNFCQYNGVEFLKETPIVIKNEETENKCEIPEEGSDTTKFQKRKIHHNVSYRIWNMKKEGSTNAMDKRNHNKQVNFNILVRSKLDACMQCPENNALQPIILKPKIELQLEYGATIPSKSDLSREWCSLFFRPYSTLYRVRIHSLTSEVVAVDKCSFEKVMSDAASIYNYSPHSSFRSLQQLFTELQQFEPGEYVLHHQPKNENFISVKKACNEKCLDSFDLHKLYDHCKINENINQSWLPIDSNYILPIYEHTGQLPGLFKPFETKFFNGKKGAKKKKKHKKSQEK